MIDFGLENILEGDYGLLLYCTFEQFGAMQKALEERKVEVKTASLQRHPLSAVPMTPEHEKELEELIAELEEDDDIQHVYHNMQMGE